MMNQHGISVIIHTYNAEQHLERVLQSVAGFDELIVCDMESTDATLAIAERHGCRILTFPRGEHRIAEPARQFAIDRASCNWILTVDADELVSPELRDYLYAHIASEQPAAGLYLARRNYFMGRFLHAAYPDYVLRFFRREQTTWAPYVHTLPVVVGEVARIDKQRHELALEHLANDSVAVILRKTNDYSDNEQIKRSGGTLRPSARALHQVLLHQGGLPRRRPWTHPRPAGRRLPAGDGGQEHRASSGQALA